MITMSKSAERFWLFQVQGPWSGTKLENFTKGGENRKIQLHDWAIIQSNCQRQKAIDSLKILLEKSPEIKVMVKEKRE
jgi:hypothetical protein